jgi:hypothetical protein
VIRSGSQSWAGGKLEYSIWVWSTTKARAVSATVARSSAVLAPSFSLCPAASGSSCHIGSLPAYQAFELLITDKIAKSASVGEQLTVTVSVQGTAEAKGSALSPAEASIALVVGQDGSSPAPVITVPAEPSTVPGLPGTTVTPGSITSLFPVVTPSPSTTPGAPQRSRHKVTKAIATASSLPLDPRLIGGQLIGLVVLAAAVTMVVARLSLRTAVPAGQASGSGPTSSAAPGPTAEPGAAAEAPPSATD